MEILFGQLDSDIPFYFKIDHLSFTMNNENLQVSSIRYDAVSKNFTGLVVLPDNTSVRQALSESWVRENMHSDIIDIVKLQGIQAHEQFNQRHDPTKCADSKVGNKNVATKRSKRMQAAYLSLAVGAVRTIPAELIKPTNPVIYYRQFDTDHCAFMSLSSILHYFGYVDEAKSLNRFREEYYQNEHVLAPDRVLQRISRFCREDKSFSKFRNMKYQWPSIDKNFDVLQNEFLHGEFALINVWTRLGDMSHAVCICRGYIFDSNGTNALDLNEKSLEECGVGGFAKVKWGYYFHQRGYQPLGLGKKRKS
jgi:hypothetical protein